MSLPALTLTQPWPAMMLRGDPPKRIENRDWLPPRKLIGSYLALHGGRLPKSKAEFAEAHAALEWADEYVFQDDDNAWDDDDILKICVLGIYAVAKVVDVVTVSDDPWFMGVYGWVLADFVPIEPPVPCEGKQRLWDLPEAELLMVRQRWKALRSPAPAPVRTQIEIQSPVTSKKALPARETQKERSARREEAQKARDEREKARYVAYLHLLCRCRAFRETWFAMPSVQAARLDGLRATSLADLRQEVHSRFARYAYARSLPLLLGLARWRHQYRALRVGA